MKFLSELSSQKNKPRLTPHFKKSERTLLSVFMRLLELVPSIRGEFLADCGFGAGKTANYQSFMEVSYPSTKLPEGRPDGLIHCQRGSTNWSAFIEAKCDKSLIRPDQIQAYAELASSLDVDAVISISNEFAREPSELPYHVAQNKRKKREIYHFSWSDLRNRLELILHEGRLTELENGILEDCLSYFWGAASGVSAYDAMPQEWSDFVQSSGVGVGFNSKTLGITEIIHGWHQERRDLRSKLMKVALGPVRLAHPLGTKATFDEILVNDRKKLAESYELDADFRFKDSKSSLRVLCELQDRKTTISIDLALPSGKAAKGTISWLAKQLTDVPTPKTSLLFDWRGRGNQRGLLLQEFIANPEAALSESKDAPKKVTLIRQVHDVRRFKSRKFFVADLEATAISTLTDTIDAGLM